MKKNWFLTWEDEDSAHRLVDAIAKAPTVDRARMIRQVRRARSKFARRVVEILHARDIR